MASIAKRTRHAKIDPSIISPSTRKAPLKEDPSGKQVNYYDTLGVISDLRKAAKHIEKRHRKKQRVTPDEVEKLIGCILLKHSLKDQLQNSQRFLNSISGRLEIFIQFLHSEKDNIPTVTKSQWYQISKAKKCIQPLTDQLTQTYTRLENSETELLLDRKAQGELTSINELLAINAGRFQYVLNGVVRPAKSRRNPQTKRRAPIEKLWDKEKQREVWRIVELFSKDLRTWEKECKQASKVETEKARKQKREDVADGGMLLWAETEIMLWSDDLS